MFGGKAQSFSDGDPHKKLTSSTCVYISSNCNYEMQQAEEMKIRCKLLQVTIMTFFGAGLNAYTLLYDFSPTKLNEGKSS